MKKLARAFVQTLGIDFYRIPDPSRVLSAPPTSTKGLILEFIGTMGVGKSHIYRLTFQENRKWFQRHHLTRVTQNTLAAGAILDLHEQVLMSRLDRIRSGDGDIWQKTQQIRDVSYVVGESLLLSTLDFPRGFALEEGLFKNCPREILELDLDEAAPLWHQRVFIWLRADDPATVLIRYKQRVNMLRSSGIFQHPETDEQILSRVAHDDALNDRLMDIAARLDRPLLVLHAEDDIQNSLNRIREFERALLASR